MLEPDREVIALESRPRAEAGEQLSREIRGAGRIVEVFAPDIVVENPAFRRPVDMGEGEIHSVPLDCARDSTDEDDGSIMFLTFHDPYMGQRIIGEAISIVVPRIVEKDEIARADGRALMHLAVPGDVMMNQPHAVGFGIGRTAVVEIDAMLEKNRSGHAGAVVRDASSVSLDGRGAYKPGGRPYDRRPPRGCLHGLAARLSRDDSMRAVPLSDRCSTTNQCGNRDKKSDESHPSHRGVGRMHHVVSKPT